MNKEVEILSLSYGNYVSLEDYIKLQNNWNELKKLVEQEKQDKKYANDVERFTAYDYVLKKMQEIESGK